MRSTTESGINPAEASSKDEPTDKVEYIDFNLKIRCAKTVDGKSKFCSIQNISIDEPGKSPAPAVASPQTHAPVVKADPAVATVLPTTVDAVPATPPVAAAPMEVPEVKDSECDLCAILADALRQQAAATVPRQLSPRQQPRRMVRS